MSVKVFLSHAWADKGLAAFKAIDAKLRSADCEVWVDKREIEFGESITPRLDAAIAQVDVVLVLWSERARDSAAVRYEIERAIELKKPLVPCKISTLEPQVHEPLRDRKYLRFDADLDFGLAQLSQFIVRLRNRQNPIYRDHPSLQEKISALNEALSEVEDSVYRRERGVSGNEASDTYIHAMLEAGKKMIAASTDTPPAEKARLAAFMSRVQAIAQAHPDPRDDAVKEAKMVEAIGVVDPGQESPLLQMFKQSLAQSYAARRGPRVETAPTPARTEETGRASPRAPTADLGHPLAAHIAAVRRAPGANAALRQRLQQLLPGPAAGQIPAYEQALHGAVDAIPQILSALAQAAQQAGVAQPMAPLLQQAQAYFFETNDLVPDHYGTLGLLDDAYLVHAFLYQINCVALSQAGVPLVQYDPSAIIQGLRVVLGVHVTQQLDQAVVGAVNQIIQQHQYQQLVQQRTSLDPRRSRTGGPGAWGGAWEDEMARMGAEIGLSFN